MTTTQTSNGALNQEIHGLAYSDEFLDSLRVLSRSTLMSSASHYPSLACKTASGTNASSPSSSSPSPTTHPSIAPTESCAPPVNEPRTQSRPIRALTPSQFSSLHLSHIISHPPDTTLFPFLHGLEGDNEAQNLFFAVEDASKTPIPRYRGLIWVICEDDLTPKQKRKLFQRKTTAPPNETRDDDGLGVERASKKKGKKVKKDDGVKKEDLGGVNVKKEEEEVLVKEEEEEVDLEDVVMSDDFDPEGFETELSDEDLSDGGGEAGRDGEDEDWEDEGDSSSFLDDDESLYSSDFSQDEEVVKRDIDEVHGLVDGESASSPSSESEEGGSMQVVTPSIGSPANGSLGVRVCVDVEMEADVDVGVVGRNVGVVSVDANGKKEREEEGNHMHPVAQRTRASAPSPPPTSSTTTIHTNGHNGNGTLTVNIPPSTSPQIPISAPLSTPVTPSKHNKHPHPLHSHTLPHSPLKRRPKTPPLLTSSFRPAELLARYKDIDDAELEIEAVGGGVGGVGGGKEKEKGKYKWKWEFVRPKVPDGISLRNFGIQVPIYATISDIVVYSPKGASPNAIKLAERFSEAMERKRTWRKLRKLGLDDGEIRVEKQDSVEEARREQEIEEQLVKYNVFVLDSDAEGVRKDLPHLVVRMCEPGGVLSGDKGNVFVNSLCVELNLMEFHRPPSTSPWILGVEGKDLLAGKIDGHGRPRDLGAHTVGTDGRIDAMVVFDCEVEDPSSPLNPTTKSPPPISHTVSPGITLPLGSTPNTVDFAIREKEEMRDLTRASEILSVWPSDSSVAVSTTTTSRATLAFHSLRDVDKLDNTHLRPTHTSTAQVGSGGPLPWTTELGQVFLGNADDVPLPDDPSAPMMHFHNGRQVADGSWDSVLDGLVGDGEAASVDGMDVDANVDGEEEWGTRRPIEKQEEWIDGIEPVDELAQDDPFNCIPSNDPAQGMGYDICFECHDRAPYPSAAHLTAAEEHLGRLEVMWVRRCMEKERARMNRRRGRNNDDYEAKKIPPRPPPNANAVIHLPFPSMLLHTRMSSLMVVLDFLEKWLKPPSVEVVYSAIPPHQTHSRTTRAIGGETADEKDKVKSGGRRWSTVSSLFPGFGPSTGSSFFGADVAGPGVRPPTPRNRSFTSPPNSRLPSSGEHSFGQPRVHSPLSPTTHGHTSHPSSVSTPPLDSPIHCLDLSSLTLSSPPTAPVTRPLKILIYSNDGYTESSVAALSLLMRMRGLKLPEAYLELQVAKRRSFYVYGDDLGGLRRIEGKIAEERETKRRREEEARAREREKERRQSLTFAVASGSEAVDGGRIPAIQNGSAGASRRMMSAAAAGRRPAAKSVSFAQAPTILPPPSPPSPLPPALSSVSASGTTVIPSGDAYVSKTEDSHASTNGVATPNSSAITPVMINIPVATTKSPDSPIAAMDSGPSSAPVPSPVVGVPSSIHGHGHGGTPGHPYGPGINGVPGHGHGNGRQLVKGRPRANTSPWLPSLFGDHQTWFNDNRFDGSFPSRVLPFLYLGNLNHASNAYMLHALGITHVVSVGECALVPPPHLNNYHNNVSSPACPPNTNGGHFIPGKGPGGQGSLWMEEREGRIKVLDIKGICDDGIDTLEPQLEPICEWIDRARAEGGQVLVHCRVGVSRSATVVIAYVMKHLHLPLVDAYLIVRSRRLSVVIQPNMRLLYNLCGWEIKLAKERAGADEERMRMELARAVSWPWLAREVHKLNEKYINC